MLRRERWKDELLQAVRQTTSVEQFACAWLGWEPHEGQCRWMSAPEVPTAVLVTGRRWGKDEVEAVRTLHRAVFSPGSRQLFASVTLDQARIPWDRCVEFIYSQPLLEALLKKDPQGSPFPLIRFRHGSIITARSTSREGVYIRGHKHHRVVVTEADYVSERTVTEAIRFTLADYGGQLVLQTTPRSRRGLVYRELQRALSGDPSVYGQQGSTFENPHVDHDYIRSLQGRMTAAGWQREVEGIYAEDDAAVFGWEHIQAAYEAASWDLPEPPAKSRRYVAGWDLAKSEDWTVGIVLDATAQPPYRLVSFERFQRAPWPAVAERIRATHRRYGCHQTLIDATGVGDAVLDEVRDVAQGYVFTGRSKVDLLTNLQVVLEKRELQFPFVRELVDELQGYEWDDKDLLTDCVMGLALAVWAANRGRSRRLVTW